MLASCSCSWKMPSVYKLLTKIPAELLQQYQTIPHQSSLLDQLCRALSLTQLCIQLSLSLSLCADDTFFQSSNFILTLMSQVRRFSEHCSLFDHPPSLFTPYTCSSFCGRHGPCGVHLHVFVWTSFALDSCAVFSQEDAGKLAVRLSSPRVRCQHSSISVKDPNSLL